jgi:hypothetical protein
MCIQFNLSTTRLYLSLPHASNCSDAVHLLHELAYAPRGSSCRQIYTHRDWSSNITGAPLHLTHVEHPRVLARLGSSLVFIHLTTIILSPRSNMKCSLIHPWVNWRSTLAAYFHRSTGVLAEISFDSTLFTERYILMCFLDYRIHRVLFINESFKLTTEADLR